MADQYFGKYTGIVKDNRDDQNLGQLKVSVPTIYPPDELIVARPALPYGFFFVPEKEAKVWIEFEGGDSGLPLWTGIQYVQGEWAGEAKANPPQRRVIKTASGHLLMFKDKDDEASIEIYEGVHRHVIVLNKDGISIKDGVNKHEIDLNKSGISVNDKVNNHSVTLDGSGVTVRAKSGAKLTLTSTGATLETTGTVQIKGASISLGDVPLGPVMRGGGIDQAIGNLGAPVVMISTSKVTAA